METTVTNSYYTASATKAKTTGTTLSAYQAFIKKMEFNYFPLIAAAILVGSCVGSIAAMKIFQTGAPLWMFVVGLSVTMSNLVASIGQAPTKWVVNLFGLSLLVNIILILTHLI